MMQTYKETSVVSVPKTVVDREITFNFNDIFLDNDVEENPFMRLSSILDYIEITWLSKPSNMTTFPLPIDNIQVDILTQVIQIFKDYSPTPIECFPDSFYHFIICSFMSNENPKIIELVLEVILGLSMYEFNNILIPFFTNFKILLQSNRTLILVLYIEICINFICNTTVFNILHQNDIISEIFKVIQTSGNALVIKRSFEFLSNYLIQFYNLNDDTLISDEIIYILKEIIQFIGTTTRNELLPFPFILLDFLFDRPNKFYLEQAKTFDLEKVFSNLFLNENNEVFLASAKLLNAHWPKCSLFDDNSFYQRFLNIIQRQSEALEPHFFINSDENNPQRNLLPEDVQMISIDILQQLLPNHLPQFYKYNIIESILYNCDKFSFQVKEWILLLLLDYLTYSSVATRRNIFSNYSKGTNPIAVNAIDLIINSTESQHNNCILMTITTLILMKNQDYDFWMNLISSIGIIESLENVLENSDDEKIQLLTQSLLNCFYSYSQKAKT